MKKLQTTRAKYNDAKGKLQYVRDKFNHLLSSSRDDSVMLDDYYSSECSSGDVDGSSGPPSLSEFGDRSPRPEMLEKKYYREVLLESLGRLADPSGVSVQARLAAAEDPLELEPAISETECYLQSCQDVELFRAVLHIHCGGCLETLPCLCLPNQSRLCAACIHLHI
jgi:hypothetical protein